LTPASDPHRRYLLGLALLFAGIAVCGSWVPFEFQPVAFSQAWGDLLQVIRQPLSFDLRADWAANLLLLMPVGFFGLGAILGENRSVLGSTAASLALIVACGLFAVSLEFSQCWFRTRVMSQNDMAALTLGSIAGAVMWLTAGRPVLAWLKTVQRDRGDGQVMDRLLQFYLVGLVLYSVYPLNLTIRPRDLLTKYRDGRVTLLPFAEVSGGLSSLVELAIHIVLFLPVGLLVATQFTHPPRTVRRTVPSLVWGAAIVFCVEVAQLLVRSRHSSMTDIFTGMAGVGLGIWLARHFGQPASAATTADPWRRTQFWLSAAAIDALLVVGVFFAPFQPLRTTDLLRERYEHFFSIPFASMFQGDYLAFAADMLKKGLLWGGLGFLAGLAAASMPIPGNIRRIAAGFFLVLIAALATAVEILQIFFPPHVPDVTDILPATIFAALGIFLARFAPRAWLGRDPGRHKE
jgi:VanZ family protein